MHRHLAWFLPTIIFCFAAKFSAGQNPASLPRDTTLSMPEKTFETFWLTFEDRYAFFKIRKIDWKETYRKYRPMINSSTSDDSLFSVLSQMVATFQDDHINIIIPNQRQFTSEKPSRFMSEFSSDSLRRMFWQMADTTLYRKGFPKILGAGPAYRGRKLFEYSFANGYGYLRFTRCFASTETEGEPPKDAALSGDILDSVLELFGPVKAMLIDVRVNIGGNDDFAYAVANRFTSKKILGHTKHVRVGGYENFGPPEEWYIEPKGKKQFIVPIAVLTNDQTASAGDVFAMIMKALPDVKTVGENTLGIYSDMYGFELPNKWLVSLSHQRYYAADGKCYESIGTPVDKKVKNTKKDLVRGEDPVIIAAINMIDKKR